MFKNITKDNTKNYKITNAGEYVFYFENKNGNVTFDIRCENADVKIYGLYTDDTNPQKFKLHITQKHTTPNSESTTIIKSTLKNESTLNITSTINIDINGINTNAHFVNKNLLLNDKAQTIVTPQLEVIPGNVSCTHATSTTPLDKYQLQYLVTRGINVETAQQLLIEGFLNEILILKK